MKNCIYNETQSFLKSKTILIPLVLLLFFIYGFYHQFILKIPFGNHPMSNSGFLLFFSGYMLFLIFFISISLDTKIFEDGISIRFFPIQFHKSTLYHLISLSAQWEFIVSLHSMGHRKDYQLSQSTLRCHIWSNWMT